MRIARELLSIGRIIAFAVGTAIAAHAAEVTPIAPAPKPSETTTEWIGVAVSPNGRVFQFAGQRTADEARSAAKHECEEATRRDCETIGVPSSWDIAVLHCTDPKMQPASFVAGSIQDMEMQIAYSKAHKAGFDPINCVRIYLY